MSGTQIKHFSSDEAKDGRLRGNLTHTFMRGYLGIYNTAESYLGRGMCKVYPAADVPQSNVADVLQPLLA